MIEKIAALRETLDDKDSEQIKQLSEYFDLILIQLKDFNDESKFRKKLKDISKYGNVASHSTLLT
jgi:hypothetical protein